MKEKSSNLNVILETLITDKRMMWWYESINLICFTHQGLLDFFLGPSLHHVEFEFENVQESQEKYVIGENKQLEYPNHY